MITGGTIVYIIYIHVHDFYLLGKYIWYQILKRLLRIFGWFMPPIKPGIYQKEITFSSVTEIIFSFYPVVFQRQQNVPALFAPK